MKQTKATKASHNEWFNAWNEYNEVAVRHCGDHCQRCGACVSIGRVRVQMEGRQTERRMRWTLFGRFARWHGARHTNTQFHRQQFAVFDERTLSQNGFDTFAENLFVAKPIDAHPWQSVSRSIQSRRFGFVRKYVDHNSVGNISRLYVADAIDFERKSHPRTQSERL